MFNRRLAPSTVRLRAIAFPKFIPYTGWGNTVTTHIYSKGIIINKPVAIDWQWGGSEDRYPDGEVFKTLKDAEKYSLDLGFPIILTLNKNDIANPSKINRK